MMLRRHVGLRRFVLAPGLATICFPMLLRAQVSQQDCRQAAAQIRAFDQALVRSGGQATEGEGKRRERDSALRTLLQCEGSMASVAAASIRETRFLSLPTQLSDVVGPYAIVLDSAVIAAAIEVSRDRLAAVPARVFAVRTLFVLQTGRHWVAYNDLLPDTTVARLYPGAPQEWRVGCGRGIIMSHNSDRRIRLVVPLGYQEAIRELALALHRDSSESAAVRAAAFCALSPPG